MLLLPFQFPTPVTIYEQNVTHGTFNKLCHTEPPSAAPRSLLASSAWKQDRPESGAEQFLRNRKKSNRVFQGVGVRVLPPKEPTKVDKGLSPCRVVTMESSCLEKGEQASQRTESRGDLQTTGPAGNSSGGCLEYFPFSQRKIPPLWSASSSEAKARRFTQASGFRGSLSAAAAHWEGNSGQCLGQINPAVMRQRCERKG